jgi:hypothetical protein
MLIMIGLDIFDAGAHDFEALQYTSAGGFVWNGTDWVAYVDADFLDYRIAADYDGGGSFSAAAPSGTTHFRLRVRGATLADSPVVYEGEPEEPSSGDADTPSTPTTTTITFVWKVNGVPTDVTSAVLADPTDAYGVERTDNNAVVVVADTPLVKTATGTYAYTFTDPAGGLTYHYYVKVVYDGVTYHVEKQQSGEGSDDSPTTYGTRAGIEGIYGTTNVSGAGGYADVNDNGTPTTSRLKSTGPASTPTTGSTRNYLRQYGLTSPATADNFSRVRVAGRYRERTRRGVALLQAGQERQRPERGGADAVALGQRGEGIAADTRKRGRNHDRSGRFGRHDGDLRGLPLSSVTCGKEKEKDHPNA